MSSIAIQITHDFTCPWCARGEARERRGIARSGVRVPLVVTSHAFEVDPARPRESADRLARPHAPARQPGARAAGRCRRPPDTSSGARRPRQPHDLHSEYTMNANLASSATACPVPQMARGLILLFAFSCGAIVANLYYAQPIIALIAPDLHMSGGMASLIVSLTQIGYAAGLFFLVPLGDLVENKKLMVVTALMSIASLALAATVRAPGLFLAVSLIVGFSSVAVQLLIPLAAHLAPSESRGRVVGTIMSGLLLGILLSRPVASFIADHFGWRAVFAFGAATMAVVTVLLMLTVPSRRPAHQATYMQLIRSLGRLVATQPVLRERSLYQGLMFGSFSLFWSAAPVELMHSYNFV